MSNRISDLSGGEMEDMCHQLVGDTYTYVTFPDSQKYMEEEWFEDEAILDVNGDVGSSYLIPTHYVLNVELEEY